MKCIKCSAWFFVLLVFAAALAPTARAGTVVVTITGHIYSGTDTSSLVFGLGSTLNNTMAFTLEFTYDDTKGTETGSLCSGGTAGYVSTSTSASDNPGTAKLTITSGGSSPFFTFGGGGNGQTSISSYAEMVAPAVCNSYSYAGYGVQVNYSTGGFSGGSSVGAASGPLVYPYSGSLSSNFDWRAPVSLVTLKNLPAGWYTIPFNISYTDSNHTPSIIYNATGYLNPEDLSVSGFYETPASESTVWTGWLASDSARGVWTQTLLHANSNNTIPFTGQVREYSSSDGANTCFFDDGTGGQWPDTLRVALNYATSLSNSGWWDSVGWVGQPSGGSPPKYNNPIDYYRTNPTGFSGFPCYFTFYQRMQYQWADGSWHDYGGAETGNPNTLNAYIYSTFVTSQRAGLTTESNSR
jgi:hypothetical protein